jgi:hypothetical protein
MMILGVNSTYSAYGTRWEKQVRGELLNFWFPSCREERRAVWFSFPLEVKE